MISVKVGKRYYQMARQWNELTGQQLIRCLDIINSAQTDGKKMLSLVRILTRLNWWQFAMANVDELAEYFYLLDFLFEQNTLTKNLLPVYRFLHGPGDNFSNLVVSEFIFAENHYLLYREHGEMADLDKLIAVLYRPGKPILQYNYSTNPEGDYRRKFNDNLIDRQSRKTHQWPLSVKHAILHYYEGCRAQLVSLYGDVFGGAGEPAKRGMLSLVVSVAEQGTFGSFEKVEQLLLHTFMIGLSEAVDKANKIKVKTS